LALEEEIMTVLRRMALALAAAAVCGAAFARAEEAVLVSSTVPGYASGSVLSDGQILDLPAGASATLLFRSGAVVRLRGPYEGRFDAAKPGAAPEGAEGLVQALRGQGVDATVVGATRGFIAPAARASMSGGSVTVEVKTSAIYCVGSKDTLWLHNAAQGWRTIKLRRGKSVREVAWPEGAERIEWPTDLGVEDGDRFEILDPAGAVAATLIFHRMAPTPSATAWIAAGLLSGCRTQAEPALQELAREIESGG
jgi:hypothetical protein